MYRNTKINPSKSIIMRITPRYIIINLRKKEGFVVTDATEVARIVGISIHTIYGWSRKNKKNKNYIQIERDSTDFIVIRNPKVIKSKKGNKMGFNKNI